MEEKSEIYKSIKSVTCPVSSFRHRKCKESEVGKPVKELPDPNRTTKAAWEGEEDVSKYKYVSIVVAKEGYYEQIKKMLKKYNIEVAIRAPLKEVGLKGAQLSGILYHNVPFEDMANVVSYNNDFKFDNRYLLIIFITDFIKLNDRTLTNSLSETDFNSLSDWLKKQYPNETLRLWEYREGTETEFYL